MPETRINGKNLDLAALARFDHAPPTLVLDAEARETMQRSADTVGRVLQQDVAVYGINTGFGALASRRIEPGDLARLQYNLVRSHAAGIGDPLPERIVRRMLLLKANALATGVSGVRPVVVEALLTLLNRGVTPRIPERGSVGASGDLAPLAHLALALIGEGEATRAGELLKGSEVMHAAELEPLELAPKEGLALLNGTQLSTALALEGLFTGESLLASAIVSGALAVEGLAASYTPFDARIHAARGQRGQIAVARAFRSLLTGSEIWRSHRSCTRVQDPYSSRCQPQVLGAVWDTLAHAAGVLEREANGATDNPLVFGDDVISGGNFHAEPIALVADFMSIALSEIGALAERRIDTFMRGINPALPEFLAWKPGLESGFMLAHVSAAALASENKTLAHPASVDTLPTSAGQEDHVSMAPWAGLKLLRLADNVAHILAIELLTASAALDHQKPLTTTTELQRVYRTVRAQVGEAKNDRRHDREIAALAQAVNQGKFAALLPAWNPPRPG